MPRRPRKPPGPRPAQGVHLANLRKAAGLTQTELAEAVEVSQANIAFWERSAKPPRSDVLARMAKALGVPIEALLYSASRNVPRLARSSGPTSQVQRLFEAVRLLPRRDQQKILDVVEALLDRASPSKPHRAA